MKTQKTYFQWRKPRKNGSVLLTVRALKLYISSIWPKRVRMRTVSCYPKNGMPTFLSPGTVAPDRTHLRHTFGSMVSTGSKAPILTMIYRYLEPAVRGEDTVSYTGKKINDQTLIMQRRLGQDLRLFYNYSRSRVGSIRVMGIPHNVLFFLN